jgi:hypothetical protein
MTVKRYVELRARRVVGSSQAPRVQQREDRARLIWERAVADNDATRFCPMPLWTVPTCIKNDSQPLPRCDRSEADTPNPRSRNSIWRFP